MLKRISAILLLFLFLSLCMAEWVHSADHAVIVQYHFFGREHPEPTTVSMDRFRTHLSILKEENCHVWPLSKVTDYLRSGRDLPDMCVAITIDDAYKSVLSKAVPLLEEFGYPATLFIPTAAVDAKLPGYMSWDQIREAMSRGIEPASHSHHHRYMVRRLEDETAEQWCGRVREDIVLSVSRLEKELGTEIGLFAYPYGEYNTRLRKITGELGLVAVGQHSGPVGRGSDFQALPRFPVSGRYSDPESFRVKISSLPFPLESADPESPLLDSGSNPPVLRIDFGEGDYIKSTLTCYVSGQGKREIKWIDRNELVLEVRAGDPLPAGRSRYNITARHINVNRYFWYSHLWINMKNRAE